MKNYPFPIFYLLIAWNKALILLQTNSYSGVTETTNLLTLHRGMVIHWFAISTTAVQCNTPSDLDTKLPCTFEMRIHKQQPTISFHSFSLIFFCLFLFYLFFLMFFFSVCVLFLLLFFCISLRISKSCRYCRFFCDLFPID